MYVIRNLNGQMWSAPLIIASHNPHKIKPVLLLVFGKLISLTLLRTGNIMTSFLLSIIDHIVIASSSLDAGVNQSIRFKGKFSVSHIQQPEKQYLIAYIQTPNGIRKFESL